MFNLFKKENNKQVHCENNELVAMADGEIIDVKGVSDPMFADEMMGKTIAFKYDDKSVTLCAPCNGTLSVLYPTGHAFGITTSEGIEVLVHIGINTYETNGQGFKTLHKQGDVLNAGEPIVKVDYGKLKDKYDMSTMLIITNTNGKTPEILRSSSVEKGTVIVKFN